MLPQARGWLAYGERAAPGNAPRQQDQCERERIRRPPRFHLPPAGEGQLFPEEEILRRQGCPRPGTRCHEHHEIDANRRCYPAQMHDRLEVSHEVGLPGEDELLEVEEAGEGL